MNTKTSNGARCASSITGTSCSWSRPWRSTSGNSDSPAHGYKLAADYCQHYDSRHGNGLNGPSRTKIEEMARFVYKLEEMQQTRP